MTRGVRAESKVYRPMVFSDGEWAQVGGAVALDTSEIYADDAIWPPIFDTGFAGTITFVAKPAPFFPSRQFARHIRRWRRAVLRSRSNTRLRRYRHGRTQRTR